METRPEIEQGYMQKVEYSALSVSNGWIRYMWIAYALWPNISKCVNILFALIRPMKSRTLCIYWKTRAVWYQENTITLAFVFNPSAKGSRRGGTISCTSHPLWHTKHYDSHRPFRDHPVSVPGSPARWLDVASLWTPHYNPLRLMEVPRECRNRNSNMKDIVDKID